MFLILNDIRSAHNVGSIFRTAECVGVSKVFLVGVTPDPIDRFGRARRDIAKVSLGAEKVVSWEHREDIVALIKELKKEDFEVVALEQDERSIDYKKFGLTRQKGGPKSPLVIILGEEVHGLPKKVLDLCDQIVEIKMMGEKESLNVSVAAAVALFRILEV